jgi:hypothetical protein
MSRTFRRQTGNRWWALHGAQEDYCRAHIAMIRYCDDDDELQERFGYTVEQFNSTVIKHTHDGLNGHSNNRNMKTRTNEMRRTEWIRQRSCFYKHPDEHNDFYDSKAKWKSLWWVYH